MKLQVCSTLVFVSCAFSVAVVQAEDDTNFYQELTKDISDEVGISGAFQINPTAVQGAVSSQCDPRRLEDTTLSKQLSTAQYHKAVKQYFARCEMELASKGTTGLPGILRFTQFQYKFFQHPQVKSVILKLEDGTRVPGILALKQDSRPRPLVIMRCGVFCSADETTPNTNYLMHLFDQSPFNVLMLASQTGLDYIEANKKVTLGGFSEGYESLQVGKWMLEKWSERARISSLHLMGVSLGGNAAVFGAHFNDQFPREDGRKVFSTVTAICPVISLKPTLDHLYGSQIVGSVMSALTKDHFIKARQFAEDVPDLLEEKNIPSRSGMSNFIGELASTSLQRRGIASTTSTFFKSNNFWNLKEEVKTPMLVWASKDDMVVNNGVNARTMQYDDTYEDSSNVSVLNMKYGNHCGFSSAYGFQASAAVLRSFVLSHSPEFKASYQVKELPWTHGAMKLSRDFQYVGESFKFEAKSSEVTVSFKIFNSDGGHDCEKKGPLAAPGYCLYTKEYTLPVSSLRDLGARVPRTTAEAQSLTREFNTKVEFRTKSGPLNGTRSTDFVMRWKTGFE